MRFAVPAVEVLDLRFEGLVEAHPSAVALRIRRLEGDFGPVVEADTVLEGLAIEALYVHVCPWWVQNVDYRSAFQYPVDIGEIFSEELLDFLYWVEEP